VQTAATVSHIQELNSVRIAASTLPKIILDTRPRPDARGERVFRQAVAQEMLDARETARNRGFDPNDARWKLAQETQGALQGTVLAFEDRRTLLALAQRLGIRSFDANLIVAIVQDRARRGEPLESAAATIAIIPAPTASVTTRARRWFTNNIALIAAVIILVMIADALLIGWVLLS
jgi:hypothetical protein